jgi:membrane protein required for colicin V production
MPLTILDIVLIVIMLISGVLAMMRGFTREVLSIASWGAAALAAFLAYPRFRDLVRAEIQPNYLADAVLIVGVFLTVLLLVSVLTARVSDAILDSKIGPIDRTFGFIFGLGRGLIIVVIAFLFFSWLVPADRTPTWIAQARMKWVLQSTGNWILAQLPEDPEAALQRLRRPRGEGGGEGGGETPAPAQPAQPQQRSDARDQSGYRPAERAGLNQLIQGTTQAR